MGDTEERERAAYRRHETYEQNHWTVVDLDSIDKVFATALVAERGAESVRVDFDGEAAPTAISDIGNEGDNITVSACLPLPEAVQLRDQLTEAIENARSLNE